MKKLPLGIQTFSKIINGNMLYVDKTREISDLISSGSCFFLSRPRRFGKSLLVSTLKEIFQGNRELFKGLYIYDKINWERHPVIHFDFSMLTHDNPVHLKESLFSYIDKAADNQGVQLKSSLVFDRFGELIQKSAHDRKVVILVDEYDKPIIDHITNPKTALENREVLKNFFSVLKGSDSYLHFIFLTGVSKFSKVSVFSGLNNIKDITVHKQFATMTGITHSELLAWFPEHIEKLAEIEGLEKEKLIDIIRHWYNGYSWDGITRLYNPYSLLNLFFDNSFGNYWFATGTPTFLIKTIKDKKADITGLENRVISSSVMDSYDIDHLDLYPLLFQTGYLTISEIIKKGQIVQYRLNYPNYEVKESFLNHVLASFTGFETVEIQPLYMDLIMHLSQKNIPAFTSLLESLFSRIPYNLHIEEERYYHSLCYMILALMGAKINLEVLSDKGRMDGVLELDTIIYVIEFKMGGAEKAIKQIKEKRYWESYMNMGKELFLSGIGGFKEKKIDVIVERVQDSC